jgi:FkbM family methyltransferase
MLIPLQYLVDKYQPKFKGVIHVGAHYGEEVADYIQANMKPMLLFEPCKEAYEIAYNKLRRLYDAIILRIAIGAENKMVKMQTASFNKGESNSILQPKLHLQQHPEVVFDGEESVWMTTLDYQLDNLYGNNAYPFNFLAMDVQGYEGEVIKGATETLKHIDYIYSEVNRGQTYAGNIEIDEFDELLKDFKRVETKWAGSTTWGDAFYIRKPSFPADRSTKNIYMV